MDNNLVEKVKQHVNDIFREKYDRKSSYHSFEHTREVAEAAEKIGRACNLKDDELEEVVVAAWFHDTGYLFQQADHESISMKAAGEFLKSNNYPDEKSKKVIDCISATRINHIPSNLMEEVIHDADYINLANPNNFKQSKLLMLEAVNYGGAKPTEEEWLTAELKFLMNHSYYTAYGRTKLEEKKSENIKRIKKKLKNYRKNEALILNKSFPFENEKSKSEVSKEKDEQALKKELDKKEALSIKGFETIYRLTSANHMRLNAIADRKANIMLTLNGIVISITMSIVASDADANPRLIIPTSILVIACLVTIIFATLATRPTITSGTISKEDIENKKANLLFFGNFSRMVFEEFDWGIRKVIRDQEYLHNSMILDFYNLGKVLDKKFRYLRICYSVFMYGIIISVLTIATLIALGY
ncbi:MAG: Pycsar system effector family protein [Bacteroidota bacterium]